MDFANYDNTRERLLDAAGQVFALRGFQEATVREICQLAKANVAAINYHFRDKQTLYIEAVKQAHCQAHALVGLQWPEGLPPRERLRIFIAKWLEQFLAAERPSWHMALMLREMANPTEACAALVESYIRPMANVLRGILRDLLPLAPDTTLWQTGFSIVGQCLFYKVQRPIAELLMGREAFAGLTTAHIAEHITRFCLAALGEGPSLATLTANNSQSIPPQENPE